jgi:aldehyde:ferredoxin oxidoreductase
MSPLIGGYVGRILRVDLWRKKAVGEPLSKEVAVKYVGGYGLGGRILYDEVPPWVAPLDPENRLLFATGPLTGIAPIAGRYCVITKSPLTGYFGDANSGGLWGAELKRAGYDVIILSGRSFEPIFLFVSDGKCEIHSAKQYWGLNAREGDRAIRKDLGERDAKAATIGIAGENLVRFAGITNDEANRMAARCGVGAVMGFKKVKAVVVRGDKSIEAADPDALKKINREIVRRVKSDQFLLSFTKGGTPSLFEMVWEIGDVPAYNWSRGDFGGQGDPAVPKISYPGGYEAILSGIRACHNCPIACRRICSVKEGPYAFEDNVEGPEYETQAAFGPNCGIEDIKVIAKLNDLCNLYGLDTISAGSTVAFAMECFERGLIDTGDTDGIDLRFGNGESAIEIIHKIAKREGFGNILAEGTRRAARIIGAGAEAYAIHVKGMEIAMHDPRAAQGIGVHYACAPTGGRHTEGLTLAAEMAGDRFSTEGKAALAKSVEDWAAFYNAAGFCHFALEFNAYTKDSAIETFNVVTGVALSYNQAMLIGERIFNLKRAFNMKHGATSQEDTLPDRLLKQTAKSKTVCNLSAMLPEYYKIRGWDMKSGKPTVEKLLQLGLDYTVKDLWG